MAVTVFPPIHLPSSQAGAQAGKDSEPYSLAVLDSRGTILSINGTWREIASSGAAPPERTGPGVNYLEICDATTGEDADDAHAVAAAIRSVVSGDVEHANLGYCCTVPKVGRRQFEVHIHALGDSQDRPVVITHHDVTAQRARSISAEEIRQRLGRLVDGVHDFAIYMLDPHGNIQSWNTGAYRLTGWTAEEVLGRHYEMLFSAEERAEGVPAMHLAQAIEAGTIRSEGWRIGKSGAKFFAFTTMYTLRDAHGTILGFAKVSGDVTALRQAETRLAHAFAELQLRNTELEQFVYTVSHDLKTPLVTIAGFASHLRDDLTAGRTDRMATFIDRILAASGRMNVTLDDLLKLSGVGRVIAPAKRIDVAALASAITGEMAGQITDRQATVVVQRPVPPVLADPTRLREVLENLIGNALKYGCPESGMQIEVGGYQTGREARIFVRDHGPGVPADARQRVFGLFQRLNSKSAGTGVGLAIVKRVMDVHGGSAWVEDTPGGGATFVVSFPVEALDSHAAKEPHRSLQHEIKTGPLSPG